MNTAATVCLMFCLVLSCIALCIALCIFLSYFLSLLCLGLPCLMSSLMPCLPCLVSCLFLCLAFYPFLYLLSLFYPLIFMAPLSPHGCPDLPLLLTHILTLIIDRDRERHNWFDLVIAGSVGFASSFDNGAVPLAALMLRNITKAFIRRCRWWSPPQWKIADAWNSPAGASSGTILHEF